MDAQEEKGKVIRGRKWIGYLSILTALLSAILLVLELLWPQATIRWLTILNLSFLVTMSLTFVITYINRRIFLYTDHLVYRTTLRKTYVIPYQSIKGYARVHERQPWRIYTDERTYKFLFDRKAAWDELEAALAPHVERNNQQHGRDDPAPTAID